MATLHDRVVDPPRFPRAPSHDTWEAMTPAQRAATVAALPAAMTEAELAPSEGDAHFDAKADGRDTLRTHFARSGTRIYVAAELTVYYPDEDRFSPDLLAVRDVETGPREKWVVDAEGRGLDWVMEVLVRGDRRKDLERNVTRYARLFIPEYFVFDHARGMLRAWRLADPKIGLYSPIVPQRGAYRSEVLGMELYVEDRRVRFRQGSATVFGPQELILRLEDHMTDAVMAREEAERLREDAERLLGEAERQREEAERQRDEVKQQRDEANQQRQEAERQRDAAEARAGALQAELDRLRRG